MVLKPALHYRILANPVSGHLPLDKRRQWLNDAASILHAKVYLDLWVTVKKGWTVNDAAIRQSLMP